MLLTLNQLERCVPYLHFKRLELILPNLNRTLVKYGIDSNRRLAHFLGQLLIESNSFRFIQDPGSGKDLENREDLGNTSLGDGRKYIGRGYFKLRGKAAYQAYKAYSKIDVVAYPHFVTTPHVAMDIAGWIWSSLNLNTLADQDDVEMITKILCGADVLLREREDAVKHIKKVIGLVN